MKEKQLPRRLFFIISFLCVIFLEKSNAQSPVITIKDFETLQGKWKGKLMYLDYSSNKQQTIPCNLSVELAGENKFSLSIYYTEEPDHNSATVYEIKDNGRMINERKVVERSVQSDGTTKIVTEEKGTDGNDGKAAVFHHEMLFSKNSLTITKLVRFEGEEKFFQRNQYAFTR